MQFADDTPEKSTELIPLQREDVVQAAHQQGCNQKKYINQSSGLMKHRSNYKVHRMWAISHLFT